MVITDNLVPTYIKRNGNLDRICLSPNSDAVSMSGAGLAIGNSTLASSEQIGGQIGSGELSLGGRSSIVLITRELLYRACELTTNLTTDKDETIEVYKMFLNTLAALALQDIGQGSQPLAANTLSQGFNERINKPANSEESEKSEEGDEKRDEDCEENDDECEEN